MLSLRDRTIVDNVRPVYAFASKRIPPGVVARIGGLKETASCLMPIYIVAVDAWLDRGQGRKLSTYVYTALRLNWYRVLSKERYLIKFPTTKLAEAVEVAQLQDGAADTIAEPESEEIGADEASCLAKAIAKLPPYEAAAVADLLRPDPRPMHAIGAELGITKEWVRQARFSGLLRLREDETLKCELGLE